MCCPLPLLVRKAGHVDDDRRERRRTGAPRPAYPAELPITAHHDELLDAIAAHQVIVVAGETGSGKSTQLPKLCLEAGRGIDGLIGHTQPRRIAARSVAERLAEELGTTIGDKVGFSVRFNDRVGPDTYVKVMTDGILLAEMQRDRSLRAYDTIIVDEAHERSLNIDFLLGYLRQLLPRRPDLKVIVTSATIDTARFSAHFGGAPVIEVSGRGYPVEVRYRPLTRPAPDDPTIVDELDQVEGIADALDELGRGPDGDGDVLVFLSGEREIRDTADHLEKLALRNTEIVPLYARLSAAEQHRIFETHRGRRVVLATNVAETSLTVPGMRFVIDAGNARISRYNRRTKVQRLPIEAISQASANRRAGRCGRTAPGICIRLYDEDDFVRRPAFTEPEILRTNIASVILQMAAIGLGDIAAFPFVEPPDRRSIQDGVDLLEELGAFAPDATDETKRITAMGRRLARLPVDPRLGRMVLEAELLGCAREVMIIVAGLSIQDPRERPKDKEAQAAQSHARFRDPDSDFVSLLKLWAYLEEQQHERSAGSFRRMCKAEHLHYLRTREWRDVCTQLHRTARDLGIRVNHEPAQSEVVHQALLAGLLGHIGAFDPDRREYQGVRQARFIISPSSTLSKSKAAWVMAGELVETNRLWAHTTARIKPEWIERTGAHLIKRSHGEPWWDAARGAAVVNERATLYGLNVVPARRVQLGGIDPVIARDMFLHHALVEGDWTAHHAFITENAARIAEVRAVEDRVRRRNLVVDDGVLLSFFEDRVPAGITSAGHFNRWWKNMRELAPDLLDFPRELLIDPAAGPVRLEDFPDRWGEGSDIPLELRYEFAPLTPDDGATIVIPVAQLNRVSTSGFDWHIAGVRPELVAALLRWLPKGLRQRLMPVTDHAAAFLASSGPDDGVPLLDALAVYVRTVTGEAVPTTTWRLDALPEHLRLTFEIVDERGRVLGRGEDLGALRRMLVPQVERVMAAISPSVEQTGLTAWTFGDLPLEVEQAETGARGYPALVDEGESVGVRVFDTTQAQRLSMWQGTRRLLLLAMPPSAKLIEHQLTRAERLALASTPYDSFRALLFDATACAIDVGLAANGGPVFEGEAFASLAAAVAVRVPADTLEVVHMAAAILGIAGSIATRLDALNAPGLRPAAGDIREQLDRLVRPRFLSLTGRARLPDVLRYMRAIERRLDKLPTDPIRDRARMGLIADLQAEVDLLAGRASAVGLRQVRWQLEELRVSTFAQELGTSGKVSETKIRRELALLRAP